MAEHSWRIPTERITIAHEKDLPYDLANAQAEEQIKQIVAFARLHAPVEVTQYGVEVIYKSPDAEQPDPKAFDTYDAVLVDVHAGTIIATYPPYSTIDPTWSEATR